MVLQHFGALLDSKVFDMVGHRKLFCILITRGLPTPIICFISSWYQKQEMKVQWGSSLSQRGATVLGL